MKKQRALLALGVVGAAWLAPAHGSAHPQWSIALVSGLGGEGAGSSRWTDTTWYNAVHADVILGRTRNASFGLGPYADAGTSGFSDGRFGGGLSLVVPVHEYVPILLSGGGYARTSDAGWNPGWALSLFVGSRSYNFHSTYGMTGGLVLGYQQDVGDSRANLITVGAQIDFEQLLIPGALLYQAVKGPPASDE